MTEADKTLLLEYLRKEHGAQAPKNKITLTRKQNTEIKKTDSTGKARTIQVEVRKKRVLVRNEEAAIEPPVEEPEVIVPVEEPVQPIVEPEVIVPVEEAQAPVEEVAAIEEAPSTKSKKSLLTPEQIEQRENEAKRHAALMAMQMEDVRKKQELAQKRQEEEAKRAAEAAATASKLSEGTLHKTPLS